MILYKVVNKYLMSSGLSFLSSEFASKTIIRPPILISESAGTSYYHTNYSPRYLIERNVLNIIAVIAFVEMSTRSA